MIGILTVGLDGPNRVGKGTYAEMLRAWLVERGVPVLIIRGDGSRNGDGSQPGDPISTWWHAVNTWLRQPDTPESAWNKTSYRLGRELLVWRDRVMPRLVHSQNKTHGVLLVDRTLISRTMVLRRMNVPDIPNNLYPESARGKGRRITADTVCPDVIFNLLVPKEVLLSRLKTSDPKYAFRKKLIEETADWFVDAVEHLPAHLRSRVVMVDNTAPKEAVFQQMTGWIQTQLESRQKLPLDP